MRNCLEHSRRFRCFSSAATRLDSTLLRDSFELASPSPASPCFAILEHLLNCLSTLCRARRDECKLGECNCVLGRKESCDEAQAKAWKRNERKTIRVQRKHKRSPRASSYSSRRPNETCRYRRAQMRRKQSGKKSSTNSFRLVCSSFVVDIAEVLSRSRFRIHSSGFRLQSRCESRN